GVMSSRRIRSAAVLFAEPSAACDALCFGFAMWAVGIHPRPGEFLLVYGAAMVASLVPLVPDGLGTVESVVPLLLHRGGTPFAAGLAAVLVYRASATVLPAAAGALSLVRLRLATGTGSQARNRSDHSRAALINMTTSAARWSGVSCLSAPLVADARLVDSQPPRYPSRQLIGHQREARALRNLLPD